jgi:hypothetical protein
MGIEQFTCTDRYHPAGMTLRQSLSIVLIGLVDLHFERSPRVPRHSLRPESSTTQIAVNL